MAAPLPAPWLQAALVPVLLAQTETKAGSKKINLKPTGTLKPGTETSKAANPAPGTTGSKDARAVTAGEEAAAGGGLVEFIRGNATWLLAIIGGLLALVLVWAFLGQRGKAAADESAFAELGLAEKKPSRATSSKGTGATTTQKYSSTKIQAADVNSRLSKSVKTTEVETDREYALVVDEESLKMPPLPEQAAASKPGGIQGDASSIEKHLQAKNVKRAYEEYSKQLAAHATMLFPRDVERTLGEELLKAKDLDSAANVLEHLLATQTTTEVHPDVYFNLGYIRLLQEAVPESRRYLKLYVEAEKNPAYVARAKKILERIRKTPSSN